MIPLVVTPKIRAKLEEKHRVQELEVMECFLNHDGKYLEDDREEHLTDPPTLWFVGETYRGRRLKVVFVCRDGSLYLKSAFEADDNAERIYAAKTK
ncbi:ADP-ribosyl-(dinitrogen reductase) hydrolase [Achromobacter xylosoxidans]|nr:ADP-ribosyl-(dinitrogen reductase) hydrolase [Achromobacter xylosoxidans]